ncbi:hypothetical protein VT84_26265 [Gemmata sp. SH-PL17]|uniref:hypothetical protein n=1 Tax=Gemmata sp. SH-PL17 TaxID=1630693 RepID=UPI00078DB0CC|nr:hypothetical protein [Gemmata sp. SH-PL17]AMV27936.1 hypothetical protein VT84_26265 [Gemmata sp. SH-PL17]
MPHWTTRWLVWARDNLFRRTRPRAVAAFVGYERAGATRWAAPVPWTADAAVLDVQFRFPYPARRKTDFSLRLPTATFPADALKPDADERFRVSFRFPVPAGTVHGDLLWNGRVLATVPIEVLTPDRFLTSLSLTNATVAVRFGSGTVAATAFVPDRCDGLLATAVLRCPTALVPLAELGLRAVFHNSLTGHDLVAPVSLGAAQLARTEAVVTAVCPEMPPPIGAWWVTWIAGTRALTAQRVHVFSADRFADGVRVLETRFAILDANGTVRTSKLPPALTDAAHVGPCFVLSASEPGAAALCRFEVTGIIDGAPDPATRREADTIVTDGPTVFVPSLFDVGELAGVSGFELRLNGRLLGSASLRPVPAARLTGEGGFIPPPEFAWSAAADHELIDRLKRLSG